MQRPAGSPQQAPRRRIGPLLLRQISGVLMLSSRALMSMHWALNERIALMDFTPRPDDTFLVTYPRSGTNWMQMIMYQLTTDGDMERLTHILHAVPWFEVSLGRDFDLESLPSPRIMKSHLAYPRIPHGAGRYIYIMRDGKDVVTSYFYHEQRLNPGFNMPFDMFFEQFMRGKVMYGSWFDHVAGWWAHHNDPNVLFLRYEDLQRDLAGNIRKIADFCWITIDPARLPTIVERSSFAFMKQYEQKFDPMGGVMTGARPADEQEAPFLRKGVIGDWKTHLSEQQRARFDEMFDRRLRSIGIDAYPAEVAGAPAH